MIIYQVTNTINGKIYIGLTTQGLKRRKWQHLSLKYSGATILGNAIAKYGDNSFIFKEIDTANNIEELIAKEKEWIIKLNTLRPNGYNILPGHVAGAELAKSRFVSTVCLEDGKQYMNLVEAAKTYGVPRHSVWSVCSGRTDFAGNFSFRYLDKQKFEIAENKRSKRILKSVAGYATGAAKTSKKIICITTGEIFESVKSAAEKLNIDNSQIIRVCSGKNKHAKGLIFAYLK